MTVPAPTGPAGTQNGPIAVAYAWWLVVAGVYGFAMAGMLTIGIFLMPVVVLMVVVGVLIPTLRAPRALTTIPAGLAAAPLFIAWLNRDGPGTVCMSTVNSVTCTDEWSPWPFVAVAAVLVVVSVVLVLALRPRSAVGSGRGA